MWVICCEAVANLRAHSFTLTEGPRGHFSSMVGRRPHARRLRRAWPLLGLLLGLAAAQSPEQQRAVEQAVASYRKAVELRPADATAYFELSVAYQQNRFMRAASVEMGHAVFLRPEEPEWRRQLGTLLARVGDPQGAVRQYQDSLALRPQSGETYFNLGNALGQHDVQGKTAAFERAIELSPRLSGAYINLAYLHERQVVGSGVGLLRSLMTFDVGAARRRLTSQLESLGRHLEAAVAHVEAIRLQEEAATQREVAVEGAPRSLADPTLPTEGIREWRDFVTSCENTPVRLLERILLEYCLCRVRARVSGAAQCRLHPHSCYTSYQLSPTLSPGRRNALAASAASLGWSALSRWRQSGLRAQRSMGR